MNKKIIPIVVQLKQNNNYIAQGINQNDAGVLFDMTVMDGLEPFNFAGYSIVTLKITRPDGTFRYDSGDSDNVDVIDPENGRLKINIPTSCTTQNGMYFCNIGFGLDEQTYFETMSFNYFVGTDPQAEDDDVIGTNEFPVLTNLIAQTSEIVNAETARANAELTRVSAEEEREHVNSVLIALFTEAVGFLEDKITDLQSLLQQVNEALAEGGSIDVSQINALATKTYVETMIGNSLNPIDFGDSTKDIELKINRGTQSELSGTTLNDGELYYTTDTNILFIGNGGTKKAINTAPYSAGSTAPTDTSLLWIDTSGTTPVIKYYANSTWNTCSSAVFA